VSSPCTVFAERHSNTTCSGIDRSIDPFAERHINRTATRASIPITDAPTCIRRQTDRGAFNWEKAAVLQLQRMGSRKHRTHNVTSRYIALHPSESHEPACMSSYYDDEACSYESSTSSNFTGSNTKIPSGFNTPNASCK